MARRLVQASELLDIAQYEKARPEIRAQVMALKDRRRLQVGPHFNFLFENHATLVYQIQEMMRVERIVDDKAIADEVETYNELVPPEDGLSATLLLEYDDRTLRESVLPRLRGIENHVRLLVGDLPPVPGQFDRGQIGDERVSSVQYLQFVLPEEHRRAWMEEGRAGRIRLAVDHPEYSHEAVVPPEMSALLAEDFA